MLRVPVEANVAEIFWPIRPALPMPGHNHAAAALVQVFDGAVKVAIQAAAEFVESLGFELNDLAPIAQLLQRAQAGQA